MSLRSRRLCVKKTQVVFMIFNAKPQRCRDVFAFSASLR